MSYSDPDFEHASRLFEAVTRHIGRTVGRNTTVSILELQLEMGGGLTKFAVLAPLLSFIIIIVKKALAGIVYWHPVQARFSLRIDVTFFGGFFEGRPVYQLV